LEEINQEYIDANKISVVRRISGGGAVYHDLGNLNFSFITNHDITKMHNFKKFTQPVIKVLNEMGVNAEMSGRNDILVEGRKISGNAQFSSGKRMFSHGTLLLNSDLDEVTNALNVKMSKIQSKGHKSVRSRVANIVEFLDAPIDIEGFRTKLLEGLYRDRESFETYHLSEDEWKAVHALKEEKYGNWDWNFGRSPKFDIQRTKRFSVGEIDFRINVQDGRINEVKIYGDFFGKEPVSEIEELLLNTRYSPEEIEKVLHPIDVQSYFGNIQKEEFIQLVYGEDD
jgi:lipoate-protein ligase A